MSQFIEVLETDLCLPHGYTGDKDTPWGGKIVIDFAAITSAKPYQIETFKVDATMITLIGGSREHIVNSPFDYVVSRWRLAKASEART